MRTPVGVPVLLGTGEHDDFTTPEYCREVVEFCADARFTLMRDADHAVHLQVPDALADLLLRFFTGRSLDGLAYCHPVEYYGAEPGAETPAAAAAQPAGARS